MRVCLFEDARVLDLEPLTLTRPAFDLRCGLTALAEKQRAYFGATETGALIRPELAAVSQLREPCWRINDSDWLRTGPTVLVNARWLPPPVQCAFDTDTPCIGVIDDEIAYAVLGSNERGDFSFEMLSDRMAEWQRRLPTRPVGGTLFRHLWEIMAHNPEQMALDCTADQAQSRHMPMTVVGDPAAARVDPTARVEPFVVADTTRGPVVIAADVIVTSFTRLEGPCYIGAGTHLLGARVRSSHIGPHCRIGGEVECSVIQGYTNKAHEGFLGHAYLGEWVNLGAGTQCSDLRNDYGEVSVAVAGTMTPTGQTKVGCFLGDHTKTGIGALINTGTNAGAFCQMLPEGLLPRQMPSFASWWRGKLCDRANLEQTLETAGKVMRRRGQILTDAHAALYRELHDRTAHQRRRAIREYEVRRLRQSA